VINWLFVVIALLLIVVGYFSYKAVAKKKQGEAVKEAQLEAVGLGKESDVSSQ
jgi:hypothetical protein